MSIAAERDAQTARAHDTSLRSDDRTDAAARADIANRLLEPDRRILAFDPRGRGQVAEVYGNLDLARRISVVVPGSDVDLTHFDRVEDPLRAPAGMARALLAEEHRHSPGTSTAVIAWAGYTTPVGLGPDTATARLAEAGAPRLERFLAGLAATTRPVAAPALFCHSYGSVICGVVAPRLPRVRPGGDDPRDVHDLVVFGSPGMGVDDAADLGVSVRLWATRNPSDWIGEVPYVEIAGLGHGADPTEPDFGARVVSAAGAVGHTGYFAPDTASLRNFAAIALGRYHEVG
jgi:hypothetical protein